MFENGGTKMKLVILDSYAITSEDLSFDAFGTLAELSVYPRTLPEEIVDHIGDAELVITNKCMITEEILQQCPNLKYVGVTATGYNIVDLDACKRHGVAVTNVPAYSTKAVAQQVFAYILFWFNRVERHHQRVMAGEWQNCQNFCFYEPGLRELEGKTIGLIGFGNIAKRVAFLADAFDMKVKTFTRTVREEDKKRYPYVEFVSLPALLAESDIVSIHCPLTEQTKEMIAMPQLKQMKKDALLINTSRGGVLTEKDVKEALDQGIIGGACVDVASVEPIRGDNPLLSAKNILITPHTAWAPRETRERLLQAVYGNLESFLNGKEQNRVV